MSKLSRGQHRPGLHVPGGGPTYHVKNNTASRIIDHNEVEFAVQSMALRGDRNAINQMAVSAPFTLRTGAVSLTTGEQ
jgi:hypothetical protein